MVLVDGKGGKHIPMNPAQYLRMKTAFERQGGEIHRSPENDSYMDYTGVSAITSNEKSISFRNDRDPTATEVFEEFIHATQFRQGKVTANNRLELEIEAAEKLIRNQSAYGIPESEHLETIGNLEQYKSILKQRR